MEGLFRVSYVGTAYTVQSREGDLLKKNIVLNSLGGGKYPQQFLCTCYGELANKQLKTGDLVAVALRPMVRQVQDKMYQDILIDAIQNIG